MKIISCGEEFAPTIPVETASLSQIARSTAYRLARDDAFPLQVIRFSPTQVRVMTIPAPAVHRAGV